MPMHSGTDLGPTQEIAMSMQPPPTPEHPADGLATAPPSAGWSPPLEAGAPPAVAAPLSYCRGCGNPVHPQATICVNCGVATGLDHSIRRPANPKSKTTAVVLVVLFGLFGWIYTYQRDAWKFWLNLGLTVVTIGLWGLVAWIWAIIDVAVKPGPFYESFPNG